MATALSEISRSAVTAGRTAVITFGIDGADLLVTVSVDGEPPADGIAAAARLMDQVDADGQRRADDQAPPARRAAGSAAGRRAAGRGAAAVRPGRAAAAEPGPDQRAGRPQAAEGPAAPAQRRAPGDQPRRHGPVRRAVGRAGADQPRRGGAVRGAGREVRAAARGLRIQGQVLGQRQPRAAHPAELHHRADPAAGRARARRNRPRRRAALPDRADPGTRAPPC